MEDIMSKFVLNEELGKEFCDALGLDANDVFSLDISCAIDKVSTLVIGRFLRKEEIDKVKKVLEHYELKPKEMFIKPNIEIL